MHAFFQRRSVRICRVVFRWTRICVWLLLFIALSAVGYLHLVGLPNYLKRPILSHLRARGFEAGFSRMRLGFGPSIIIENASFQRSSDQPEPKLTAARAELEMQWRDWARARLAIGSLEVADARLQFPPAGESSNALSLDNIQLQLFFVSTNFVRLTNTSAAFRGVRLNVDGELTNAQAVREWKSLRPSHGKIAWQTLLSKTTDILDQIHFARAPRIELDFTADALDLNSIRAHLSAVAPDVTTPWGDARKILIEAAAARILSTNEPIVRVAFGADDVATPWAQGAGISLTTIVSRDPESNYLAAAQFVAATLDGNISTNAIRTSDLEWNGAATLQETNFHLLRANGDGKIGRASSKWGAGEALKFHLAGDVAETPPEAGADWGPWSKLARYRFDWGVAGSQITATNLQVKHMELSGKWRAPLLEVGKVSATLYGGRLDGRASVNAATRGIEADGRATFDERRITPWLTPAAQRWFAQFAWDQPPEVSAHVQLAVPSWTNRPPDWKAALRPTLRLTGEFTGRGGAFRGVAVESASGSFSYTNRTWSIPHLRAVRPDGQLEFSYAGSDETHDYHFLVDSDVDPKAAAPLLPEEKRHWLDEASFATPPHVHADIWGRWHAPELTGIKAQLAVSNFVAHGESVDSLAANIEYTNKLAVAHDVRFVKGKQYAAADLAEFNFATKRVFFTNALGAVDVDFVRRISAPRTPKFLQLIQFDQAPAVRVSGTFTIGDPQATQMRFAVAGRNFHYTNLVTDAISGSVDWRARHVVLTNVQAGLYNTGSLVGKCTFDYVPKVGTSFQCDFTAKDVDLPALARSLTGRTNKLEGMLDGQLTMDCASAKDRRTWNGSGSVHVHNALLWDIKMFGILSPALNAIVPGAGNSSGYDASASFVITNGVIATDDLVAHSTGFRLLYRGTVDTVDKRMDARVEAEVLRDTRVLGPLLGALFSPLSKLFEYRVTGDLRSPKKEPVFIPAPLMMLLRPFHTLRSMGDAPPAAGAGPVASPSKK
ncbi:MAG TPA: hypothetical protein VHB20_13930 [Verrucomicrobiae bacterium]|jgi:hypothetical protein|nr:hypothetical protein [Verrucomicrobiae bacterium]